MEWHALIDKDANSLTSFLNTQGCVENRVDGFLPKVAICTQNASEPAQEMKLVSVALDWPGAPISSFRYWGTRQQMAKVFPQHFQEQPAPGLWLVNEERQETFGPFNLDSSVTPFQVHQWIGENLSRHGNHVHIVLGAPGGLARHFEFDIRSALWAFSCTRMDDSDENFKAFLDNKILAWPIGGDPRGLLPQTHPANRGEIQLRQCWICFHLHITPNKQELKNVCCLIVDRHPKVFVDSTSNSRTSSLVFVGHGTDKGFILQDKTGYSVCNGELTEIIRDNPQETLSVQDLSSWFGSRPGSSVLVCIVTCHAGIWEPLRNVVDVHLSPQDKDDKALPDHVKKFWATVFEAMWKHLDKAIIEDLASKFLYASDLDLLSYARDWAEKDLVPVAQEKCVFLADFDAGECIRLTCWPARNGDTYTLTVRGAGADHKSQLHMIIDSGYENSFKTYVMPHVMALKKAGQHLNAILLTHIDQDHLEGFLEWSAFNTMFSSKAVSFGLPIVNVPKEWVEDESRGNPDNLRKLVKNILCFQPPNTKFIRAYRVEDSDDKDRDKEDENLMAVVDGGGPARVKRHKELAYRLEDLHESDIVKDWKGKYDTEVIIVNPTLELLQEKYDKEECKKLNDPGGEERNGITYANIVGIVTLLKSHGRMLLFTGDAHHIDIVDGLKKIGALPTSPEYLDSSKHICKKNPLALLTVPHHGSKRNSDQNFFNLLPALLYVISTDGSKHEHPDNAVLKMLATSINRFNLKGVRVLFSYAQRRKIAYFKKLLENSENVAIDETYSDASFKSEDVLGRSINIHGHHLP